MACPVLVVEDDADFREGLVFWLESEGFVAIGAADGEEALGLLRRGLRPCLILLDLMMPVKSGLTFRAEQLDDPELAAIPTAVLSAVARELVLRGIVAALHKPVDVSMLRRIVSAHCGS
jgi:CheY-like chemotaxis protein